MDSEKPFDIVIIGGGWGGITHAKTHLSIHPDSHLLILDKNATLGGTWSKRRLYPGLKTNNTVGTIEFSDYPLNRENGYDIDEGQHIPGTMINQYLNDYCTIHDLHKRFRFEQDVKQVMKLENAQGWVITIATPAPEGSDEQPIHTITTRRLVVATGLTSETFIPEFEGSSDFGVPIVHCGRLLDWAQKLSTAKRVTIFGGTKSAWDAAYQYATNGVEVDWVIRESGHGPCWMTPPKVTPLQKCVEKLVSTRILTFFSPCIWGEAGGYVGWRNFLHKTALGRSIVQGFWSGLGKSVLSANEFDKHTETKKLAPWIDAFWIANGLSILNYPTNFFDLVKDGKITIHVADITRLSKGKVHIAWTGDNDEMETKEIPSEALICSTGWKFHPPLNFVDSTGKPIDMELGLPHHDPTPEKEDPRIQAADQKVLKDFPALVNQPVINPKMKPMPSKSVEQSYNRGFQLYRFIVPPALAHERTLVFQGCLQTICTVMVNQAQALWSTAYFDGKIDLDNKSEQEMKDEALLYARFSKWRAPGGYGSRYPDFAFDSIPYIDWLLKDVGINPARKSNFFAELFYPYTAPDYKNIWAEYKEMHDL